MASDILSFIICRSHTSILSWSLSFYLLVGCCRDVKVLLVDDTDWIGSSGRVLYIAFSGGLLHDVFDVDININNSLED